jgi:hypothetical protein
MGAESPASKSSDSAPGLRLATRPEAAALVTRVSNDLKHFGHVVFPAESDTLICAGQYGHCISTDMRSFPFSEGIYVPLFIEVS